MAKKHDGEAAQETSDRCVACDLRGSRPDAGSISARMKSVAKIAGLDVRLPEDTAVRVLSDPGSAEVVRSFVLASPDHTVYHRDPYLEHARRDDGATCDLALFLRHGTPTLACPIHRRANGATTGYSGVVLPEHTSETNVRRAVALLTSLFALNQNLEFECLQSVQATGYDHPARMTLLARYFDELDVAIDPLYSRVLRLAGTHDSAKGEEDPTGTAFDPSSLENPILRGYEPSLRSKVRQAITKGLTVEHFYSGSRAGSHCGYVILEPLHLETWARSDQMGHSLEYWLGLSAGVSDASGAEDLVTVVKDLGGNAIAGTVCHLYRGRAIYWSGCSATSAKASGANPLCLHAAITCCARLGIRAFEMGRFRAREMSAKELAITQYKRQFGGQLVRVVNFRATAGLRTRTRRRARDIPARIAAEIHRGRSLLTLRDAG
jgi:hypothetical protein